MKLRGQRAYAARYDERHGEHGYAMAALIVAISVMAILMTAVMPVWKQSAQREKEAELVFRGQQYVHAIQLFQRKSGPGTYPPSIDFLVQQKFLRKKYKDPITNDDFQPLYANAQAGVVSAPQTAQRPGQQATATPPAQQTLQSGFGTNGTTPQGGIIGVTSKSKDASIKIYNGREHYNEWAFVYIQTAQQAG